MHFQLQESCNVDAVLHDATLILHVDLARTFTRAAAAKILRINLRKPVGNVGYSKFLLSSVGP